METSRGVTEDDLPAELLDAIKTAHGPQVDIDAYSVDDDVAMAIVDLPSGRTVEGFQRRASGEWDTLDLDERQDIACEFGGTEYSEYAEAIGFEAEFDGEPVTIRLSPTKQYCFIRKVAPGTERPPSLRVIRHLYT